MSGGNGRPSPNPSVCFPRQQSVHSYYGNHRYSDVAVVEIESVIAVTVMVAAVVVGLVVVRATPNDNLAYRIHNNRLVS